jgi:hypothetical protein
MRKKNLGHHHRASGVATADRPRRIRFVLAAGTCALVIALAGPAMAASSTAKLPTDFDAMAFAPNSQTILFGQQGIETRLPGPVDDREQVVVGLSTDGSVARVQVTQRLTLFGTGDFSFKVSGPARDVEALPDSAERPGLRKGALLWQGFAAGQKLLAAQVELFPNQEAERLPLRFSLSMTVGGRPLEPGIAATGPFELRLGIENISAVPIGVADGEADAATLAPVLDTLRRLLASGHRPIPGTEGIPERVTVGGPTTQRQESVEVPFGVGGQFRFPLGSLVGVRVTGGEATSDASGVAVRFGARLGGGSDERFELRMTGQASHLRLPSLEMTGRPVLPVARVLRPPFGGSWSRAVGIDPSRVDGRRMLGLAMDVLWRVARLRQFDAYLGNPDIHGTSTSSYTFRLAPLVQRVAGAGSGPARAGPVTIAIAVLFLALLALGLALLWAYS